MSVEEYNNYCSEFEKYLFIRNKPVAVKMIKDEKEIPEGAIRPKKDRGHHIAQCQAFALSRRQGETVAMLKEDHWCFAPLMAYGLVEDPEDEFIKASTSCPRFERDKYIGMLTAPGDTAKFEPDMIMLYLEPGQVRKLLMAVKFGEKISVYSEFDPIDSCAYAIVPVIEKQEYRITIPDPGEYARSAAREDELIFSIPKTRIPVILSTLKDMAEADFGKAFENIEMLPDFPRPDFYKNAFKQWGLDTEED